MNERIAIKPVHLLLSILIVAALAWWLWPRKGDGIEVGDSARSEQVDELETRKTERRRERRDLAGEAKASASGTVRSAGGGPLADAQVCARPMPDQLRGLGDRTPKCTRTGADGHWRLDDLWPVRTEFDAAAVAHAPRSWRTRDEHGRWQSYVTLAPADETQGIDFELEGGGVRLAGVIKDLSGGEIEGALIEAGSRSGWTGGGSAFAFSDAEGRFELWVEPGELYVSGRAEGYGSTQKQAMAPSERVELFLTPESVLVGQVVHAETGEPIADATVSARVGFWFGGGGDMVRSDAEGRFRIGGLSPGVYKPTAVRDDVQGQAAVQVHLGLGQTSEPIEIRVHPAALVEGRVIVAGSDQGCRDGDVTLARTDEDERAWSATDDEGRVTLRGLRPGEYQVEVSCEGMLADDEYPKLTIAGEDQLDQVWEVREGQAIRGVVVDSEGKPVADAQVAAQMIVDAANARAQATRSWNNRTEDDGSFEVPGLLPGRYEISAWAEQPSPEAPLVVELPVGADLNDVRVQLLASGKIAGRVVDEQGTPQPGVHVIAQPLGKWNSSSSMTDDQGNFVIEHVRTGEVRVRANDQAWGEGSLRAPGTNDDDVQGERVEVIAGGTVEIELRIESRTGVIRGKVFDEHGASVDDAYVHAERTSDSAVANAERGRAMARWGVGWNEDPILSDIDGSFTIDELAEGIYMVRAYRRGGGEAMVEGVAVGSTVELTIASTGKLAGKVVVKGGQAPETFTVRAADRAQFLSFRDQFLRTDGQWELSELPAGKYEVIVDCGLGTAKLEVELAAGERREDLELVLTPRVTLRGRLIDIDSKAPIAGMQVEVRARGSSFSLSGDVGERKMVSDAEGRFEVERAPTGTVDILTIPRGFGTDTSEYTWAFFVRKIAEEPAVQDIGDLELIAKRLDPEQAAGELGFELRQHPPGIEPEDITNVVGLIRPTGPAAATELAVGDVIETVDGKSVTGLDSGRYYQLTNVPAGTAIKLGLADGKTVTITAAPPIE